MAEKREVITEGRKLRIARLKAGIGIGIGVCLVGNFCETEVPDAQLNGLIKKVVQLIEAFKLGVEAIELHRDVPGAATECPGRFGGYFFEGIGREF